MKKTPVQSCFAALGAIAVYMLLLYILVYGFCYVIAGFSFGWSNAWENLANIPDLNGIALWANCLGAVLIGILCIFWLKRTPLLGDIVFCWKKNWSWISIVWLLVLGLLLQLLLHFVLTALYLLPALSSWMAEYLEVTEYLEMGSSFRAFLYTVLAAPVVEELLFRGVVLGYLRRGFSDRTSVLVSALLFAIIHFNWIQGGYAFLLGILLGHLCLRTKSLWMSIFLHMFINLGSFFVFLVPDFGSRSFLLFAFLALLTGAAAFFVYRKFEKGWKAL